MSREFLHPFERALKLYRACRKLILASRTSGGTAGPDPELMSACDEAEAAIHDFRALGWATASRQPAGALRAEPLRVSGKAAHQAQGSSPMTLLELAERCEKATGRDDRLALEIALATNTVINAAPIGADGRGIEHFPDFTASLDAALTLVPEGWQICEIGEYWRAAGWGAILAERPTEAQNRAYDSGKTIGVESERGEAKTPALALCAAALRARAAASGGTHDD